LPCAPRAGLGPAEYRQRLASEIESKCHSLEQSNTPGSSFVACRRDAEVRTNALDQRPPAGEGEDCNGFHGVAAGA